MTVRAMIASTARPVRFGVNSISPGIIVGSELAVLKRHWPSESETTAPWLHFQALHHMKPRRESTDGVDPGMLEGISSFRAHGKEGPASLFPMNIGWCIKFRDTHVQNAITSRCFQCPAVPNYVLLLVMTFLRSRQHLRYDLGRVVDRGGLQSSGGKVSKLIMATYPPHLQSRT